MHWLRRRWIYTDPFQPVTYQSVLGPKLVEMWHSEQGIQLDGSSNVQNWTGQVRGFVLTQTLGAAARPLYGPDAAFGNKNVVQCTTVNFRCLAYKPGAPIFGINDHPGIVHISRFTALPPFNGARNLISMGAATAPTPPAIFTNDFFDGELSVAAQPAQPRRRVIRTRRVFTPLGLTFNGLPADLSANMTAFGLTNQDFVVYVDGQTAGSIPNNAPILEAFDQLVVGASTESGTLIADCNCAMVFLVRDMVTQFEALQLYNLAQAEWGI